MPADYIQWLRSRIGVRKTLLVFATALVRDDQGRLLLHRRTDFPWWGPPGGALELGETIRECLAREVAEETGYQVEPLRLTGLYASPEWDVVYPNGDQVQQFSVSVECRLVGGTPRVSTESTESSFFPMDALPQLDAPWYRAMVRDIRETGGMPYFDAPLLQGSSESYIDMLRQEVGSSRLILPAAAALIQNDEGSILLGLRSDCRQWGLPAGLMELGETPAGTVMRETREELGIQVRPTRLAVVTTGTHFFNQYPDGNQVQGVLAVFRAHIEGGELNPDGFETLDAAWFRPEALPLMPSRHARALRLALDHPLEGQFE